jgi:hypothetical protein
MSTPKDTNSENRGKKPKTRRIPRLCACWGCLEQTFGPHVLCWGCLEGGCSGKQPIGTWRVHCYNPYAREGTPKCPVCKSTEHVKRLGDVWTCDRCENRMLKASLAE